MVHVMYARGGDHDVQRFAHREGHHNYSSERLREYKASAPSSTKSFLAHFSRDTYTAHGSCNM